MLRPTLLFATLLCAATSLQAAETRYITDVFEVTMRSGTSTSNSIVSLLSSGQAVTVLEKDLVSQYSLVETDSGKRGYVLTRFLMDIPAAKQSLQELTTRHAQQQENLEQQIGTIAELEKALEQEKADNDALKTTLRASEEQATANRGRSTAPGENRTQ